VNNVSAYEYLGDRDRKNLVPVLTRLIGEERQKGKGGQSRIYYGYRRRASIHSGCGLSRARGLARKTAQLLQKKVSLRGRRKISSIPLLCRRKGTIAWRRYQRNLRGWGKKDRKKVTSESPDTQGIWRKNLRNTERPNKGKGARYLSFRSVFFQCYLTNTQTKSQVRSSPPPSGARGRGRRSWGFWGKERSRTV